MKRRSGNSEDSACLDVLRKASVVLNLSAVGEMVRIYLRKRCLVTDGEPVLSGKSE